MSTILLVEDKDSLRRLWQRALGDSGHDVLAVATVREALATLDAEPIDLLLTDLRLPDGEGTEVVSHARSLSREMPIVMMTAFGSVRNAVEAMKLGATDFLEKPVDLDDMCARIQSWLSPADSPQIARELSSGISIVGSHPTLQAALRLVDRVAPMESTVLLLGESGTGKELFAQAVHDGSERRGGPFVAVNCAALPADLIENELFGHERGAFTGADRRSDGRFAAAEKGTLLLDEIGELPLGVQAKVLRVLEQRTYERVGGGSSVRADVRLVAATNRDLQAMVDDGEFRADLYYRLEVFPIRLPALRERRSDIPALAVALAERVGRKNEVAPPQFTDDALELLQQLELPGNVRQLANLVERAVILTAQATIDADLLKSILEDTAPQGEAGADSHRSAEEIEVRRALKAAGGDRVQAAALLGVSQRTLQRRVAKFDLGGFPQYRD